MRTCVLIVSSILSLQAQSSPGGEAHADARGIPPRVAPTDYQSQAEAGSVTIAAEFTGHAIPTLEGPLTSEDYVAVELALYGPAGAHLRIAAGDFSLRINGKKAALPSQPYGMTLASLKDPEWIPPDPPAQKSKSSIGGSAGQGGQQASNDPPEPVKIPVPVQRAMAHRVQKASLPEGDRALPQAGLIFFKHRGKTDNLQSVELIYEGPAGKATLKLQ